MIFHSPPPSFDVALQQRLNFPYSYINDDITGENCAACSHFLMAKWCYKMRKEAEEGKRERSEERRQRLMYIAQQQTA